ncbi:hypothetical protein DL96DRAFT_897746 [Flagelloscypha sp. PMI_526]|nr:hypothetical protein DL96DRAFT_897746 [Flagelloscypha sp. PMI_526]
MLKRHRLLIWESRGMTPRSLHESGHAMIAILYAIPEFYSVVIVTSQVIIYGGLVGTAVLAMEILVQLLLHCLPSFQTKRHKQECLCVSD